MNQSKNELIKAAPASPTPAMLLQLAIKQNVDIDKMKQLMDLQDRWEQKEAKKSFLIAMSKFQTMVPPLKKGKTAVIQKQAGGSFSYNYADLGSIAQGIKESLNKCGLSYRWEFQEADGKMKVTCFISHLDGHTETTSMEGTADNSGAKNTIQQKGSTHTYLQRYTLIGALGLSTADQDTDGKTATHSKKVPEAGLSEEDVLDQWKQCLSPIKTPIELRKLYTSNQKAVDANPKIQALFKAKEAEVKGTTGSNPTTTMP